MGRAKKPMSVDQIVAMVRRELASAEGLRQTSRTLDYLERIAARSGDLKAAVASANERKGTAFFATTSNALAPRPLIAVRIHGRQIGTIEVEGRGKRHFRPDKTLAGIARDWTKEEWASPQVRRFVRDVKAAGTADKVKEALVQNALFLALAEGSSIAKPEALLRHQPVLLQGLPYQFPLPVSAAGEVPRVASGNKLGYTDVLARQGNGSRLRVFELKAPGASDARYALAQAVAYAAALEELVKQRPECMFAALGYSKVRSALRFEAFAVVEVDDVGGIIEQAKLLAAANQSFALYVLPYEMSGTEVTFMKPICLASPAK